MKPVKQPISSTSFITQIFKLSVINLQKKEAVKRAALIFFVLVCIITRYIIISKDNNLEKHNNQATISTESINLLVWPTSLTLKNKVFEKRLKQKLKIYKEGFK